MYDLRKRENLFCFGVGALSGEAAGLFLAHPLPTTHERTPTMSTCLSGSICRPRAFLTMHACSHCCRVDKTVPQTLNSVYSVRHVAGSAPSFRYERSRSCEQTPVLHCGSTTSQRHRQPVATAAAAPIRPMATWEPSTLKRHEEGDSMAFQSKHSGAGVNDMCNMQELTKDTILNLLKDRFKKEIVYTYVGDIIVSVNPFKNVGAVGKAIRNRYKKGGAQNAQLLMPHCYHLVDSTYAQMMLEQKSQSILISGESGAGKTEAMKICLTYIGEISVKSEGTKGDGPDPTAGRLMQTNPVMEAIGNAKTVRNDNSSRFGKHFDLQFNEKGQILGAFTTSYLLEKPRITEHMRGERNYHIFYMYATSSPSCDFTTFRSACASRVHMCPLWQVVQVGYLYPRPGQHPDVEELQHLLTDGHCRRGDELER